MCCTYHFETLVHNLSVNLSATSYFLSTTFWRKILYVIIYLITLITSYFCRAHSVYCIRAKAAHFYIQKMNE